VGALREYTVILNGSETTMQLTEAHAKLFGGVLVGQPEQTEPAAPVKARRSAANKSRTAANKSNN
jgi:hypothetical protein